MKRLVRRYLPKPLQSLLRRLYYHHPLLRRLYYLPATVWEWAVGSRGKLQPPRSMIFVGDGDYEATGCLLFDIFKELGNLQPREKVLEIGCGIGRMAVPLTGYLAHGGSYVGMDIVPEGIRWCQRHITPRFPHFTFFLADLYNEQYRHRGRQRVSEYRFPLDDGTFDFVFLTSVFTHMLSADVDHYLGEISRVLKPEGRCLMTFFLLNDEARALLERLPLPFRYEFEGCRVVDPRMPEASIAHPEVKVLDYFQKHRLRVLRPPRYGSWCGRGKEGRICQDVVVVAKEGACPAASVP